MSRDGLAAAPHGTTPAPEGMYEDIEAIEDVARGHVIVKQLIVYEFDRMEEIIDDLTGKLTGKMRKVEKSRGPYFCQTKEQEVVFAENNPAGRIESFTIQLLKSTAIKKLNDPGNMKQFAELSMRHEPAHAPTMEDMQSMSEEPELTWRQQAKQLGIPLNKETGGSRKKEDVLADIVTALTQTDNVKQGKENTNG